LLANLRSRPHEIIVHHRQGYKEKHKAIISYDRVPSTMKRSHIDSL
jgi:hypothetical protein